MQKLSYSEIYKQIVFICVFLYILIGISPFKRLDEAKSTIDVEGADAFPILILILIALSTLIMLFIQERGFFKVFNHPFIYLTLGWYLLCTVFAIDKAVSIKRYIVCLFLTLLFACLFALPKNIKFFQIMLAFIVSLLLFLCYFGVIILPMSSIHQTTDRFEPQLAGDWRGVFQHKNIAGPLMCIFFILGLYFRRTINNYFGLVICFLSAVFILFSGAKTATALFLIAILVCSVGLWFKNALIRNLALLSPMLMLTFFGVGSVLFKPIEAFNAAVLKDPTFTGRTKIWEFALARIPDYKNFGYGFMSFWNSSAIKFGNEDPEDWGGQLSQAHNSLLDSILNSGYLGAVLTLLFLVVLPLKDISTLVKKNQLNDTALLFVRIWVFILAISGMESFFFGKIEAMWFMLCFSVFALRSMALFEIKYDD